MILLRWDIRRLERELKAMEAKSCTIPVPSLSSCESYLPNVLSRHVLFFHICIFTLAE